MLIKMIQILLIALLLTVQNSHANSLLGSEPDISSGGVTVLTVGTDVDCDYNSIQAAIDASPLTGSTEIRITAQQEWHERLSIVNKSALTLKGRYNSCSNLGAAHSIIKGGASSGAAPNLPPKCQPWGSPRPHHVIPPA